MHFPKSSPIQVGIESNVAIGIMEEKPQQFFADLFKHYLRTGNPKWLITESAETSITRLMNHPDHKKTAMVANLALLEFKSAPIRDFVRHTRSVWPEQSRQ